MMEAHTAFLKQVRTLRQRFPVHPAFNVFRALRMERDEVRLHSRLISTLTDPQAHPQGSALLHLFLQAVGVPGVSEEECRSARVVTEEGRVDILISFGRLRAVVIENKIDAPDQDKQLFRYWDHARRQHDEVVVLYLSPAGKEPSKESVNGIDHQLGDKFRVISYKYHIVNWLSQANGVIRDPCLLEIVQQYMVTINQMTGNPSLKEHMNELVELLLAEDNLERAREIRAAYKPALVMLQERMWNELIDIAASDYPAMYECLTAESLSRDVSKRRQRIERFYQPNVKDRTYFGLYFSIPAFEYAASGIEIEAGLYTGIYCPLKHTAERNRVVAALEKASIHGEQTGSWAMWRRCALWKDLYEPDEATLRLLRDPELRRAAAASSMAQVFAEWMALQQP